MDAGDQLVVVRLPGQGYPKFDQKKADEYYGKVTDKVAALIRDTIAKWDEAGL